MNLKTVQVFNATSDDPVVLILTFAVLGLIIAVIVLLVLVILLYRKNKLEKERLDDFLMGKDGGSLEGTLYECLDRLEDLEQNDKILAANVKDIYSRLKGAYQKMSIVKYDAYNESGGKLSFALAMLDERNDGFLLNVMNGRDGSYSYIKEIYGGESNIELGKEEAQALAQAIIGPKPEKPRRGPKIQNNLRDFR